LPWKQTSPTLLVCSLLPLRCTEGFLAPGQDVKLEVSFHPTAVNPDIRVEQLRCRLTGSAAAPTAAADASAAAAAPSALTLQKLPDLLLTLTGACAASEATGEPVLFKCLVRSSTSKSIRLENPTSGTWQLRPVISNDFWSGPELLQVPAGGSAEFVLCYKPLTMTTAEGQPHQGSVFFPLPDGSGLLYILHGQVRYISGLHWCVGGIQHQAAPIACARHCVPHCHKHALALD
jgi:hydrocephalus-inducing protein